MIRFRSRTAPRCAVVTLSTLVGLCAPASPARAQGAPGSQPPGPAAAPATAAPAQASPAPASAPPAQASPPAAAQLPPPPPAIGGAAPAPYPYGYAYPYPYAWAPPSQVLPERLDYAEGERVPAGYHVESGARTGLVIAGAVMLGVGWGIAAGVAASADIDDNGTSGSVLYIPVVGPFIVAGSFDYSGNFGGLAFALVGMPLILNGLVQTAGTVMLLAGLGSQRSWLQRDDIAAQDTTPRVRVGLPELRPGGRQADAGAALVEQGALPSASASGASLVGRF